MIPCIKICGLTTPQEAEYLIVNEVEYAGCVMFYEKSRRNNTPESASEIVKALTTPIHICDEVSCKIVTPDIKKVAVVVSPTVEQVKIIENIGFDKLKGFMTAYPKEAIKMQFFEKEELSFYSSQEDA